MWGKFSFLWPIELMKGNMGNYLRDIEGRHGIDRCLGGEVDGGTSFKLFKFRSGTNGF